MSQVPAVPAGGARPSVQAVRRAVALLKEVASSPGPVTVIELANRCDLNRSTAWRLLLTLESEGLVQRDPATQRFQVGHAALQIAAAVGHDAMARRVRPVLRRLSRDAREIVALAVPIRHQLTYVDQADPPGMLCPSWLGRVIPAHANSPGKVYLAWLPKDERDSVLPPRLERLTPTTITDRRKLDQEIEQARRKGYAFGLGEHEEFSNGVSAPILDRSGRPVAVIQVWGPSQRMPLERLEELAKLVVAAAHDAESLLG